MAPPTQQELRFCPFTGSLLENDVKTGDAYCPISGYRISVEVLKRDKVTSVSNLRSFRMRYGLEPLVPDDNAIDEELNKRQRATVDEACPKCGTVGLEFYTMQLRSADEGQTVFYECKECGHKYSQNN